MQFLVKFHDRQGILFCLAIGIKRKLNIIAVQLSVSVIVLATRQESCIYQQD
jgi:hypothetical protein